MRKYSLLSIMLLQCVVVFGQATSASFAPDLNIKAPEVSALLKFLDTPVSYNTGLPNITIPIFTIKEGDITYPISVDYNSSGVNVNERAGWVGMGFSINQPQVTRMVKGIPDESAHGFLYEQQYTVASGNVEDNWLSTIFLSCDGLLDLESDEYHAILPNGENIRFYFSQDRTTAAPLGEIIQIPITKNKIRPVSNANSTLSGWEITATDGSVYTFGAGNSTSSTESYMMLDDNLPDQGIESKTSGNRTSWMLDVIKSPTKNELHFNYVSNVYYDCNLTGQRRDISGHAMVSNSEQTNYQKIYATNYLLKSIEGGFGHVDFILDTAEREDYEYGKKLGVIKIYNSNETKINEYGFEYHYTTSPAPTGMIFSCGSPHDPNDLIKRLFLEKIIIKGSADSSAENKPFYRFNYNQTVLPHRFSYATDWWGYYNGSTDNHSLVPTNHRWNPLMPERNVNSAYSQAGLLTEIIYPTGGSTEYEYESNRCINDKLPSYVNFKTDAINIIPCIKTGVEFDSWDDTYYVSTEPYDQGSLLKYEMPFTIDENAIPFNILTTPILILPLNVTTNCSTCIYHDNEEGSQSLPLENGACWIYYSIKKGTETIIDYSLASGISSKHSEILFGALQNDGPHLASGEYKLLVKIYTGHSVPFQQNQLFNPLTNHVTINFGWEVYNPDMVTKVGNRYDMAMGGHRIKSIKSRTDSLGIPLEKQYDYKDENGLESGFCNFRLANAFMFANAYYINSDNYYPLQSYHGQTIGYSYVTEKNIAGNEVKPITYKYQFYANADPYSYGSCYLSQDSYGNGLYPCVDYPENGLLIENIIGNEKKMETYYGSGGNLLNTKYIIGFNTSNRIEAVRWHEIDSHPDWWTAKYQIANFYELKPTGSKTTEYFSTGQLESEVANVYNTTTHLQLTSQTTSNSTGDILETKYYYPQDSEMANEPYIQDLINNNMIGKPIDTQTFRGTTKLSEQKTEYAKDSSTNDLLLPKYIYANKGVLNIDTADRKISFDSYDSKGNITQYTLENGTPVSVVWGYNQTQPIAKIENVAYSSIDSHLIEDAQIASETGTESSLRSALDDLRVALPNSMVTTYTYIPLVGIGTITDSKGLLQSFTYDSFGRLQSVKDAQGNTLSENEYYYRTQN
jgi:YD repeat-containing protein